ncbi:MAG: hypothetical protein BWX72_01231 [Firmicutes bacterium ADurb.Bin080]|nr:MAG: hypothetical protein BWX72_01231 [Firmicutes bacterium ADurb.Bin080]
MKENSLYRIKKMVLIALMTALLSAGKFALMAVPNVEIVTISIIVGTYVFGLSVLLPATIIFSAIETTIWGFAPWVISYFVYWPLLAVITYLFKALISKNKVIFPSVIGCTMTVIFGVLTTFVDTIFYSSGHNFASFFSAMYIRGIYFYLIQVISNTVILAVLFIPLEKVLSVLKKKYYSNWKEKKTNTVVSDETIIDAKSDLERKIDNPVTVAEVKDEGPTTLEGIREEKPALIERELEKKDDRDN